MLVSLLSDLNFSLLISMLQLKHLFYSKMSSFLLKAIIYHIIFLSTISLFAQQKQSDTAIVSNDTLRRNFVEFAKQKAKLLGQKSILELKAEKIAIQQNEILEQLKKPLLKQKIILNEE